MEIKQDNTLSKELNEHFYIKLFAIALPMALQNIVTSSLNLIDTFMISALSTSAIAGVYAANKLFFLLFLFLFGISSGSAILTAQYWGVKDVKNIRRVLGVCLILGLSGAVLFTLGAVFTPRGIMRIFTTDLGAISEGANYLRIVGLSYIPSAITFSYVFVLRSTGNVKLPMKISILAILANTFMNWVLIYGNLGFPALGVQGAAIATALSRGLEFGLLLGIIYYRKEVPAAKLSELFDLSGKFVKKYLVTVMPVIANEVIWALGVTIYDLVYGRMGDTVMAAMGITKTIEQFGFFMVYSVGNGAAVILGNQMGTGDMTQVFNYGKKLLRIMVFIGLAMTLVFFALSSPIAHLFKVDDQVRDTIIICVRVLALATTFKALNMLIIVGILRSGGDTTYAMYLDGGAVWLVAVPLVAIGGLILKLDIQYVYLLAMSEEVVKAVLGLKRTYSKKWINNLIAEN